MGYRDQGLGLDIAFPRAPVSVDGAFIDIDLLPFSYWWDEGSQHTYCFEEFMESTGYKRYANHEAGCTTIIVTGPGVLTGYYHVEYLVYIGIGRGDGITNPSPGEYWIDNGTHVYITAIPSEGYVFEEWSDIYAECSTYDRHVNPTELFICGRISLRANFREMKPFDFNIQVEPSNIQVYRGSSAIIGVVVLSEGEPVKPVSLSITNTPKGVSYTFNPESVMPPASTTLLINISREAVSGSYTLVLIAASGNTTKEYHLTLIILEYERPWYMRLEMLILIGVLVAVIAMILVVIKLRRGH
ncbi:MAG: hypothetical protein QXU13_05025 [Desulfurococcaceae archaeon]